MRGSGSFKSPLLGTRCAAPLQSGELEDAEEPSVVVAPDDMVLFVTGWQRIRVGAPGTGEGSACAREVWEWQSHLGPFPGLYERMLGFPDALRADIARRSSGRRRPGRRLIESLEDLPAQVVEDAVLRDEVIAEGWESLLASVE